MKTITAKLKKSTILKKAIAGILTSSIALFSVVPAYAGTAVDQESLYPILKTSTQEYLYPVTGTTGTIYRYTTISDVLSQFAEQSTLNQKSIYTLMNTIGGYVDGIEGYVDGIEGYVDGIEGQITTSNTHLNAIKGYVDTLETLVTTSNTHLNNIKGYVDGIEGKIDTSNNRLSEIKSAIQSITTYNYTQVLSDILTNTGYLSNIDTYTQSIQDSIGYGSTGDNVLSKLSAIINNVSVLPAINTDTTNILSALSKTSDDVMKIYRRYGTANSAGNLSPISVNGLSVPYYLGNMSNPLTIGGYSYSYQSSTGNLLLDYFEANNLNQIFQTSKLYTPYSQYRIFDLNENFELTARTNSDSPVAFLSIADFLYEMHVKFLPMLGKLQYALADDDTISAKKANQAQEQAVFTNFTGQGDASASASDFGQLSNAVSSVKSGLNTNASPADVLTVFNSNDGFGWFSQATLDELDTTTQNTRLMKGSSDTPLYDSNYNAIMEYLTGGDRK